MACSKLWIFSDFDLKTPLFNGYRPVTLTDPRKVVLVCTIGPIYDITTHPQLNPISMVKMIGARWAPNLPIFSGGQLSCRWHWMPKLISHLELLLWTITNQYQDSSNFDSSGHAHFWPRPFFWFCAPCKNYEYLFLVNTSMWGIIFYAFSHEKSIKTPNISLNPCQTWFFAIISHFWHTRWSENYIFLFWGNTSM